MNRKRADASWFCADASWFCVVAGCSLCVALTACNQTKPVEASVASGRTAAASGSAAVATGPSAVRRKTRSAGPPPFCLAAFEVTPDVRKIPGFSAEKLRASLRKSLLSSEPRVLLIGAKAAATTGGHDTPKDRPAARACSDKASRVGVSVTVSAGIFDRDGKEMTVDDAGPNVELAMSVAVHVERGGPDGRPEIGVSDLTAAVPFPAHYRERAAEFVAVRLVRAANLAAADALGQLAIRNMDDKDVIGLLASRAVWQQVAALREVGERGLEAGLKHAQAAALDSRKNIALVAIGALGRLGNEQSVATLEKALDARALEVIDAALTAIADIGGPRARDTISTISSRHRSPWIRRRAAHLLRTIPSLRK